MPAAAVDTEIQHSNDIHLIGRVSSGPVERELPSGDVLLSFNVTVERPLVDRTVSKITHDVIECNAWLAKVRRSVSSWHPGDVVKVDGVLHRRWFKAPGGASTSRYSVDARAVRRLERAPR
jgi:single-strand DNA-binding protein